MVSGERLVLCRHLNILTRFPGVATSPISGPSPDNKKHHLLDSYSFALFSPAAS